jgi:hypothetical protein
MRCCKAIADATYGFVGRSPEQSVTSSIAKSRIRRRHNWLLIEMVSSPGS